MDIRLERARDSLEGLSVADAFGGYFESWRGQFNQKYIKKRSLPAETWRYTDDTEMALSIYRQLQDYGEIRQDELAKSFAEHCDESRWYGRGAVKLLKRIRKGEYWRELAPNMFRSEGSFGNGAAMRIAPLGAYFADDMDALIENARLASEVTHAHPEGIAGGIAVAVASAIAVHYQGKNKPDIPEFIEQVLEHIPESEVRENCEKAREVSPELAIWDVAMILGNGRNVVAMDTVPIALWSAVKWMDNFEEGFWQLASVGGDVDTTCAIMGGIIGSYSTETIPDEWIVHREAFPAWAIA